MFLLDSHSDGTHSLTAEHPLVTDVMLHSPNLMKKQTHPNLGRPESEDIFSTFSFFGPIALILLIFAAELTMLSATYMSAVFSAVSFILASSFNILNVSGCFVTVSVT